MWPNLQEIVDLVTFTEEILNGKLHFLRSESCHNMESLMQNISLSFYQYDKNVINCSEGANRML